MLTKDNIEKFTPIDDYNPVPKKYVDDLIANIGDGVLNHSELTELDYESSGHTGFQKQFTESEQIWFDMIPSISDSAVNAETGLAEEKTVREAKDMELETTANEALSIAKGANQALTFANYDVMCWSFLVQEKDKYRVGQNVLIQTLDVPDLWIYGIMDDKDETYKWLTEDMSAFIGDDAFVELLKTQGTVQIGYYVFAALETQKVDLNEYTTKEETNKLDEKITTLTPVLETVEGYLTPNNNCHYQAKFLYYVDEAFPEGSVQFYVQSPSTIPNIFEFSVYLKPVSKIDVYEDELGTKYFGDDCDENGVFTPQANTHYEISFKRVGNDTSGNPLIIARVGAWQ